MKCIICGKDKYTPLYTLLQKCRGCSLVVAKDAQKEINIQRLYHREYFFGEEYRDYVSEQQGFELGFQKRLELIRKYVKSGNLLEIGCAYGFFLNLARNNFKVLGIDISGDAIEYARSVLQLPVEHGDFLSMSLKNHYFDVVCMWDTIEHLQQPDLYIEKVSRLLRPGGILCLTTGNIDRFLPKVQKEKWRLIHPPTHLYYFSFQTLSKFLDKYDFEIIDESYPWSVRSVLHIFHGLGMKSAFFANMEKNLRRFSILKSIYIYYNAFDIMCVVARKKLDS